MSCVVCKKSKGKLSCGCQCPNATVHKQCLIGLAERCYDRKRKTCVDCGAGLSCLKPINFSQVARKKVRARLEFTGICFGKVGMTPRSYNSEGKDVSDGFKNQIQESWEKAVEEEIEKCPDFVEKCLKSAKKRKVEFRFSGSKWD